MARARGELTDKQKAFAHEYLKDLNATQAAIRAGYSPHSARDLGSRLLTEPDVRKLIDEAQQERADRLDVSTDRIEQELARIAFLDIGAVFAEEGGLLPVPAMPEDARRAVTSVEVNELQGDIGEGQRGPIGQTKKLKLANKLRALELLGKRHGMFIDRMAVQTEELSEEEAAEQARALFEKAIIRKNTATGG